MTRIVGFMNVGFRLAQPNGLNNGGCYVAFNTYFSCFISIWLLV